MVWEIKEIWRDHTTFRGKYKGTTHRAYPLFSAERVGYDTYPTGKDSSNTLDDSKLAISVKDLYDHISRGRGVRCIIPSTGESPILSGKFKVIFEQV